MVNIRACLAVILMASPLPATAASPTLATPWTSQVNPRAPLPEHPRPQLVRDSWINLNGRWDYAITARDAGPPAQWEGKIVVPFPVESALSGVQRAVGIDQTLWYRRAFRAPAIPEGGRLLLHFGAVDWRADIHVNGRAVRRHEGGYDPFTIDLTALLRPGDVDQELAVAVWDPTDTGAQPRGKQVRDPHGIWYTAVTGIWQTVWLEVLPSVRVEDLAITPDYDKRQVSIRPVVRGPAAARREVDVVVRAGGREVGRRVLAPKEDVAVIDLPGARAWSPDDPFLYDVEVGAHGAAGVDLVRSYFGLRKFERRRAADGFDRIFLNDQPIFLLGPLDQGWWPDGLYTAPTDEALRWDIATLRRMGFNCARKHVKIEPARWYYHADQLGLIVWQDLPSACRTGAPEHWVRPEEKSDGVFPPEEDAQFRRELQAMVEHLRSFACIGVWVPFNEGWGQHRTNEVLAWVKRLDPTRLVDGPSGWSDLGFGDLVDRHEYPGPAMFPPTGGRVTVLGEFGGLGLPVPDHLWRQEKNWGYRNMTSPTELLERYSGLIRQLPALRDQGLGAAIYTQVTDVENEVNGLVTYDRRVVKMPEEALAALHRPLTGGK